MSKMRLAVIGTGHLGRIHANLASQMDDVQLVGVVDPDGDRCSQVAHEYGAKPLANHLELFGQIDAAIVAAPNFAHAEIGCDLLSQGIHVLMEKPLATNVDECDRLLNAATYRNRILQVGHVERFNPAFEAVAGKLENPKYIEARRTSGYPARSTDIGVVLDLMIHDIDLVLSLTNSQVRRVTAMGAAVLGGHEDMAQARLEFENGCVADLVASRVSFEAARTMNVYCRAAFAGIDFSQRTAQMVAPADEILAGELVGKSRTATEQAKTAEQLYDTLLERSVVPVTEANAIQNEQLDFVSAIRSGRSPRVTGQDGRDAVAIADEILASIAVHQWNGVPAGPMGPHAEPATPILSPELWPEAMPIRRAG